MQIGVALVRFIERLKTYRIVQLFTIYLRYLIASAFIIASIPKICGERFTQISVDNPVGFYFEAMYQTGFYWNFIGWSQIIAALLLMTQRFATLGALLFYPIILNIWLVTWSIGFKGTPVIAFLMFLGNTYLLVWEYRRLWPLLHTESRAALLPSTFEDTFMRKPVWVWLGCFLSACCILSRVDFAHAVYYIIPGFLLALGLFAFYAVKK